MKVIEMAHFTALILFDGGRDSDKQKARLLSETGFGIILNCSYATMLRILRRPTHRAARRWYRQG